MSEYNKPAELEWRVGRYGKEYYGHHEWISTYTFVTALNRVLQHFLSGNSAKNVVRDGYERKLFPYALNLLEVRIKGRDDLYSFKYIQIMDVDNKEVAKEVKKPRFDLYNSVGSTALTLCMEIWEWAEGLAPTTDVADALCWFTGGKGVRVLFVPKQIKDVNLFYRKPESVASCSHWTNHMLCKINSSRSTFRMDIDEGIYCEGRGVKFDIFAHPTTGHFPTMLSAHADANTPVLIVKAWLELINMIDMYAKQKFTPNFLSTLKTRPMNTKGKVSKLPRCAAPFPLVEPGQFSKDAWASIPLSIKSLFPGGVMPSYIKKTTDDTFIFSGFAHCWVHERAHTQPKSSIIWHVGKPFVTMYCYSTSKSTIPNNYRYYLKEQTLQVLHANHFLEHDEEMRDKVLLSCSFHVEKLEYIGTAFFDEIKYFLPKLVMVKAAMGCGKTTALKSYLQQPEMSHYSILAITVRIACTKFLAESFGCYPYVCLEASAFDTTTTRIAKSEFPRLEKVVVSMESLHHLAKENRKTGARAYRKFDIVILDEVETILSVITSTTMNKKLRNFTDLIEILQSAKKVFALDALLDSKTVRFFNDINLLRDPADYSILYNTLNRSSITYVLYGDEFFLDWRGEFFRSVLKRKKVVLVSDSKKKLKTLLIDLAVWYKQKTGGEEFETDIKYIFLTGASDAMSKFSIACTNQWKAFDLIVMSPVITCGNDFSTPDAEDQRHTVFGLFQGTIPAASAIQMLGRFREVTSGVKHVLIMSKDENSVGTSTVTGQKRVRDVLDNDYEQYKEEFKYLCHEKVIIADPDEFVAETYRFPKPSNPLTNLMAECKAEKIRTSMNLREEIKRLLNIACIKYTDYYRDVDESYAKTNRAFLQTLNHMSRTMDDKNFMQDSEAFMKESAIRSGLEYLIKFGAPFDNTDYILKNLTVEQFRDFQLDHPQTPRRLLFNYMYRRFGDCSEELAIYQFERFRKEHVIQLPMFKLFQEFSLLMTSDYFKNPPLCIAATDFIGAEDWRGGASALERFIRWAKDTKDLEVHEEIYPKLGLYSPKNNPIECLKYLMKKVFPLFGIFYQKVTDAEFSKTKDVLCIDRSKKTKDPMPSITFPNPKRAFKIGLGAGTARMEPTPTKARIRNHIYVTSFGKNECTRELADFVHGKKELPDSYPFKKFFIKQQQATSNIVPQSEPQHPDSSSLSLVVP